MTLYKDDIVGVTWWKTHDFLPKNVCASIGIPKIGVESFILMIEDILVSILFNLTRATLLSLRNHINITLYNDMIT